MELLSVTRQCAKPVTAIPHSHTLVTLYLFQYYLYFHVKEWEVATLLQVLPSKLGVRFCVFYTCYLSRPSNEFFIICLALQRFAYV
jgi:hypothetical protein